MTARPKPLGRRHFLGLLLSSALSTTLVREAAGQSLDRGIGGTGVAPPTDESDRGIGGTGVIGTIRKFGSIIVNDLRIAYPPDADVRIDGQPATVGDLKIGQVVRVAASGATTGLSTRTIDVTSEVVGPIERTGKSTMTVLGQTVATGSVKYRNATVGQTVAVSGLRRNDGIIVASLIEPRPNAPSRVAGPVRLDPDGGLRIGNLALSGADGSLVGRRAVLEGTLDGDRFAVTHAASEASLLPSDVRRLSIETYVERRGDRLALGSGYNVSGASPSAFPSGRSVRAVLSTSLDRSGGLTLDSLRANGRSYGPGSSGGGERTGPGGRGNGPGGGGRSGPGPGGRGPTTFDRGGPDGGRPSGGPDFGGAGPGGRGGGPGGPSGGFGGPGGPGGGFGGPGGGFGGGGGGFGGGGFGGGRR